MDKDALQRVQKDIEQGRCVLLIGPEVCSFQEKTLIEHVHERVQEQNEDLIAYYYSKDNLFLFKSDYEKEEIRRSVQDIYRDVIYPKKVYQKILETPIPFDYFSESRYLPHRFGKKSRTPPRLQPLQV